MTLHRSLIACCSLAVAAATAPAQAPVPAPMPAPPVPDAPTSTAVLTGAPAVPAQHPPGTVTSPWCGSHPCGGPTGANGPLAYELYALSGLNLPVAGGAFSGKLNTGWMNGAGVRTSWFNPPGSAAWVLDLGINYTYNRGQGDRQIQVFTPRPTDTAGNLLGPDELVAHTIRGLHRTNFNLGIGRDVYFNGPGFVGGAEGRNTRFGIDAGGRWGTSHVDLVPLTDSSLYFRKSGVTHGLFVGSHLNWEVPFGSWIFTSGFRFEYEYTWTNIIPDNNGDLVNINLLLTAGFRF